MKLLDENGRLFGKVSLIDLLVVLIVIVMAVALHVKNNRLNASNTTLGSTPITFTVIAENVPTYQANAIQVGDPIHDRDRSSGGLIGRITSIESSPAVFVDKLWDGRYVTVTNEDSVNLVITIEGSGAVLDGHYAINRIYEIGVNAARVFCNPYTYFTGKVQEIHAG